MQTLPQPAAAVNGSPTLATLTTATGPSGLELSIFPWEDAALVVAEAEAFLAESDARPWIGFDDEFTGPDWDAIVNDPLYDRWLCEVQAARHWSGGPALACNWSFLSEDDAPEADGALTEEPGYYESTQPYLF